MFNKDTKIIFSVSKKPGNFGTTFHNYLYKKKKLNYFYRSVGIDSFSQAFIAAKTLDLYGMSVTMPFKQEAFNLVDENDSSARKAGCVNTIIFKENKAIGFNTDVIALETILSKINAMKTILIIGNGAMAQMCLKNIELENIFLTGRKEDKVRKLAKEFSCHIYNGETIDLIINTTPMDLNNIDKELAPALKKAKAIIDFPIFPKDHKVKKTAKDVQYFSGLEFTKLQAKKQFEIYTGSELKDSEVELAYKSYLALSD